MIPFALGGNGSAGLVHVFACAPEQQGSQGSYVLTNFELLHMYQSDQVRYSSSPGHSYFENSLLTGIRFHDVAVHRRELGHQVTLKGSTRQTVICTLLTQN
jgi:hypothetical protein